MNVQGQWYLPYLPTSAVPGGGAGFMTTAHIGSATPLGLTHGNQQHPSPQHQQQLMPTPQQLIAPNQKYLMATGAEQSPQHSLMGLTQGMSAINPALYPSHLATLVALHQQQHQAPQHQQSLYPGTLAVLAGLGNNNGNVVTTSASAVPSGLSATSSPAMAAMNCLQPQHHHIRQNNNHCFNNTTTSSSIYAKLPLLKTPTNISIKVRN
jgi:hypothetical protein